MEFHWEFHVGKGLFKGNVFSSALKYDSATSGPPTALPFSGSHFVLQHMASCQDVWGCHVNTQLCMLTPCVSHVEVCTVKEAVERSILCLVRHLEIMNHLFDLLLLSGKNRVSAAAFVFTLFFCKEYTVSGLYKTSCCIKFYIKACSFHAIRARDLLQNNKQGMYSMCQKLLEFLPCSCGRT